MTFSSELKLVRFVNAKMDNSRSESETFLKYPNEFVELFYNIGIPRRESELSNSEHDFCVEQDSEATCTLQKNCVWVESESSSSCLSIFALFSEGVDVHADESFTLRYNHSNQVAEKNSASYKYDPESNRFISWSTLPSALSPAESLPSHIVVFEAHLKYLYLFLDANHYIEQERFFYSLFDSSRYMFVFARSPDSLSKP